MASELEEQSWHGIDHRPSRHHPGRRPGHHPTVVPGHNPDRRPGHHPNRRPGHHPDHRPGHHPNRRPGHHPIIVPVIICTKSISYLMIFPVRAFYI